MTALTKILDHPIDWTTAATDATMRAFLDDLQANIVKGHGRHQTGHIFIGFGGMGADAVAAVVRTLGQHCTSAHRQLRTNRRYAPHLDAGVVRCLFLSGSGYAALGKHAKTPPGDAFRAGMEASGGKLADPPRPDWGVGWRGPKPDAMFLIADTDVDVVTAELEAAEGWLGDAGAHVLFVERGLQQTRSFRPGFPEGVEHFGYVDGRSQPLVLAEETAEPHQHWKSLFPPSQFLVADPNGRSEVSAGSYFVFRKLEQDVRGFNAAETKLGHDLFGPAATSAQLDRAGAMVVGRFEDGTPLSLADHELKQPVANDFNFDADPAGAKCPFHSHIRKVNPRGDVKRTFHLSDDHGDRDPIMIRRGITYGAKRPMSADDSEFADDGTEPQHHSGLLFMAYMASVEKQFEFVQQSWADNAGFVRPATGIDPVIGQSSDPADFKHSYLDGWTPGATAKVASFDKFVTTLGGEYFFAPSLSFLRGVGLP